MTSLSALDAVDLRVLRGRLEEPAAVERAVLDEETGVIWLITRPGTDENETRDRARTVLGEFGLQTASVQLEIAQMVESAMRKRVRFIEARRLESDDGAHVKVEVELDWRGKRFVGASEGDRGSLIELRTAAQAAVEAVRQITPVDPGLRLIGVKQLRAFDTELIVASLFRSEGSIQRYVGSVLATTDPARGAALAVLNALNRMLGNLLRTED